MSGLQHEHRQLIQWLRAEMGRVGGRHYPVDLDALDLQSLRALQNLLRDVESERRNAVNRARMMPWRPG
jgi:hypothetical protein